MLYYRMGKNKEAKDAIERALASNYPAGKPASLYFLAMTLHAMGDDAQAQTAYRDALKFQKKFAETQSIGDFGPMWPNWVQFEAIRREAADTLSTAIPPSDPPISVEHRSDDDQ